MNELVDSKIENMIYEIRGKQVMLDSDLAKLYGVETKRINEAVRRNPEKFPERFCWILTKLEETNLRSQIATSSNTNNHGGKRYNSRVFTEQGVAMLATVLKSQIATQVSIQIMDAFVGMREYIGHHLLGQKYINDMVIKHDNEIKLLQDTFDGFKIKNNHIFFENQMYDAYSLFLDILESSKESIVIIDNYADKKLLDLLSKTNKMIKIYSKNMEKELISKYMSQYNNVEIIENNTFHDRFIIIDNKYLYHCGASFKELGKKCFAISKIDEEEILNNLLNKLHN
ncbi:MAG: ORF6N domain-containing protein [Bacilli bacterium]|nr:ORF6N domain-containing protein [Bacilli bacterium]